jgi:pimeloyl-ACP methyl ester carboxylesterase
LGWSDEHEDFIMSTQSTKLATDPAAFTRTAYDLNGTRTVVLSTGSGSDLVFLHGAGTFTGFSFAHAWAADHKVIVPYNPNFGESGDDPALDDIEDYVLHYLDLFDRLGLRTFDLCGFSLGGWLAAEIAIRAPHRLRRLVLVAPAGLVVENARAPELSAITPPELPSYLAHDPAVALGYFPKAPDPAFDARLGREIGAYATLIRDNSQGNSKLAHWLHRITSPTLLLWGSADRMRPVAQADAWKALLPDARVRLLPDTGHLVFEEAPAAARVVADFLAE